jgi:hypothetical protein
MRNALTIAAREFEEKRFVAYAAVAFAILPLILGVIPGISGKSPQETIALSSLIFATTFAVALGVMTGASFVGRDLSDGRMSFYFARPVASSSIWFGKLTAGILMIVGCFGVIIAPAWLSTDAHWKSFWTMSLGPASILVLAIALGLFLIAHVIGTFARSHSPLVIVDFVAALITGVTVRFLIAPLFGGQAVVLAGWVSIALLIAAAVAVIGGGAWQLERGRTDKRRNHLALSQFLWSVIGMALLIAGAYVAWVVSAKPDDIVKTTAFFRSPGGPFVTIAGTTRSRLDYMAAWLIDSEDGHKIHIDAHAAWSVQYTRDGRTAFWPVVNGKFAELWRYTRGNSRAVGTGIPTGLTLWGDFIFLSDDGARIATLNHGILSIYDVAQKRSLVSARAPQGRWAQGCFVSPDRFRLYAQTDDGLQILDLDATTRSIRLIGAIRSNVYLLLDPTATRMIVRTEHSKTVTLNDAATGAVIKTLWNGKAIATSRYLRDGRIVIVDGATMHLFAPDGSPIRDIALGFNSPVWFAGDDGSRVTLVTSEDRSPRELIAIDLTRGIVERRESGVRNWADGAIWFDARPPIEPLHEVIYKDMQNHIVGWNPATGAKRRIA